MLRAEGRSTACPERAHFASRFLPMSGMSLRHRPGDIRYRIERSSAPRSSSWPPMASAMTRSPGASIPAGRSSPNGESASSKSVSSGLSSVLAPAGPRSFPPDVVVAIKAIACELPARLGLPLSRLHVPDIRSEALARGLVASISGTTIWRWLAEDALRPWAYRSWIFPRDPEFATKAGRVLDLYARVWEGEPLGADDFVICADEKTSIQARRRCYPTAPPRPGRAMRVEHEYARQGAVAYLAAWDCGRARIFGRCEPTTGIEPF